MRKFVQLCFAKRPAEELYDVRQDPHQLVDLADVPRYAGAKSKMRSKLDRWMKDTRDPRASGDDDRWDTYQYYGEILKR
jgi:hypothetical protein